MTEQPRLEVISTDAKGLQGAEFEKKLKSEMWNQMVRNGNIGEGGR